MLYVQLQGSIGVRGPHACTWFPCTQTTLLYTIHYTLYAATLHYTLPYTLYICYTTHYTLLTALYFGCFRGLASSPMRSPWKSHSRLV